MFISTIREFANNLGNQYFHQIESKKEVKVDFVNVIPKELTLEIFSFLNGVQLSKCGRVNKKWMKIANDKVLWNTKPIKVAFDQQQWETYFGDIGKVASLPKYIHRILKSPCPFWPEKTIEDTHMLVFIPATINEKPFTLKTWLNIIKSPKKGRAIQLQNSYIWDVILQEYKGTAILKPHWILITKNLLPKSKNKNCVDQQTLIKKIAKETGVEYQFPNLLETVICIGIDYITSQECLFNNDPGASTRCKECLFGYHMLISKASKTSIPINNGYPYSNCGVLAVREI